MPYLVSYLKLSDQFLDSAIPGQGWVSIILIGAYYTIVDCGSIKNKVFGARTVTVNRDYIIIMLISKCHNVNKTVSISFVKIVQGPLSALSKIIFRRQPEIGLSVSNPWFWLIPIVLIL